MRPRLTQEAAEIMSPVKIRFAASVHPEFYRTLRARVTAYLDSAGKTRLADHGLYIKAGAYVAFASVAYSLMLIRGDDQMVALFYATIYGVCTLLLAINIGHDAAHNAVSGHRRIDWWIRTLSFIPQGIDSHLWQMRHIRSHHAFPNVNGCDIDIDSNVFLRLSPNHPRRCHQRYQHLYAPFIFWLVGLHSVFIQDVQYLFKRRLANMTDIRHPASAYVMFVLSKLTYLTLTFVVPIAVLPFPWWHVLIGAVLMSFVTSMLFVYLFIGTHFAEETAFPQVDTTGEIAHDWAEHAMATSLDWNTDSRVTYMFTGGANAHAAHHLFPQISHAHYRAITRIIRETAGEFGVAYNMTRLTGMIRSHFRFLRRMARA